MDYEFNAAWEPLDEGISISLMILHMVNIGQTYPFFGSSLLGTGFTSSRF